MIERASLLADHYQKSFEITSEVWEKRNRTFLLLLVVVGGATLLTFDVAQAQPLLVDLIAGLLNIEGKERIEELRQSFPYGIAQTVLLMIVLFLTLVLYHRTTFILRSYKYLAALESELRAELGIGSNSCAFSREGLFYSTNRPLLSRGVALAYTGMLGVLLLAFLGMRLYVDISTGAAWFALADALLAVPTLIFYGAYVLEPNNASQKNGASTSTS